MKTEILFPEVGNLCGDLMNVRYLQQSCPEMEVVETALGSRPAFLGGDVDLVYMGTATETGLQRMVQSLLPYRDALNDAIESGQRMLVTGNAVDVLGEYVESDDGLRFDGLGILQTHAEYHMMRRHNSFFLGRFEQMDIIGFKSLFGHTYPKDELAEAMLRVDRGVGYHPGSLAEGFRRKNLLATYLTGPILTMNPQLTRWLLEQMGAKNTQPAFYEAAMAAYEKRLAEFRDANRDPVLH